MCDLLLIEPDDDTTSILASLISRIIEIQERIYKIKAMASLIILLSDIQSIYTLGDIDD
jgi:hypothetical protein